MSGETTHLSKGNFTTDSIRLKVAVNNVHDTAPTEAELITSFGAIAAADAGFVGLVNDAAGGTNFYIVASDGTDYFYLKMTKAA